MLLWLYPFFFFSISTGKEKERVPQEKEKPRFLPEWLIFASQKTSTFCRHMINSRTIFMDNNMTNDGHFLYNNRTKRTFSLKP